MMDEILKIYNDMENLSAIEKIELIKKIAIYPPSNLNTQDGVYWVWVAVWFDTFFSLQLGLEKKPELLSLSNIVYLLSHYLGDEFVKKEKDEIFDKITKTDVAYMAEKELIKILQKPRLVDRPGCQHRSLIGKMLSSFCSTCILQMEQDNRERSMLMASYLSDKYDEEIKVKAKQVMVKENKLGVGSEGIVLSRKIKGEQIQEQNAKRNKPNE